MARQGKVYNNRQQHGATMAVRILQGDARQTLKSLPDEHFHCCVTSPPYWALRAYGDKEERSDCELGNEPTPAEHVDAMVGVFREVRRSLRSDGLLWVNYGDTYNGSQQTPPKTPGLKPLDRVGIPEMFALAMRDDGWYWRDVIVWRKLSPMPESLNGTRWERCRIRVVDAKPDEPKWADCPGCAKCRATGGYVLRHGSWRTTRAHEYIFMFSKTPSYFADAEAIREPCAASTLEREKYSRILDDPDEQFSVQHDHESISGGKRNPRSVREFKATQYKGKHYSAYPEALPAWCINVATSRSGVCPKCGAPWAPIVPAPASGAAYRSTCICGDTTAARSRVLDPFGGVGTTALAASKLGCDVTLCELYQKYIDLAKARIEGSCSLLAGAVDA